MIPVQLLTPFWRTFQVPKDEMPEGTRQKCEESGIISAMEKAKASIKARVVFWVELLGRRSCISLGLSRIRCILSLVPSCPRPRSKSLQKVQRCKDPRRRLFSNLLKPGVSTPYRRKTSCRMLDCIRCLRESHYKFRSW